MNPHPHRFQWNGKDKDKESIKKHIEKVVTPIFNKALPQEIPSNSMTTTRPTYKILWRPNNYRRKIQVKTKDNSTISKIKSAIGMSKNFNFTPHTRLISIKDYKGITIQYGKDHITGIFSQNIIHGHKETYLIETYSKEDLVIRINQIIDKIRKKTDNAINSFINTFNLRLEAARKPIWDRYEDFIKGEEYIDSIPRDTIIHDTYFKKVYGKGIEFKQTPKKEEPGIHLKNYIINQSIRDREPLIANEISNIYINIAPTLEKINESMLLEIKNKKLHQKVLNSMDKTLKQIRDDNAQRRLKEFY